MLYADTPSEDEQLLIRPLLWGGGDMNTVGG
jgi:hypothetical protein